MHVTGDWIISDKLCVRNVINNRINLLYMIEEWKPTKKTKTTRLGKEKKNYASSKPLQKPVIENCGQINKTRCIKCIISKSK